MSSNSRAESGQLPTPLTTVVLVGFGQPDQDFLRALFDDFESPFVPHCRWAVQPEASISEALQALHGNRVPVVLCDRDQMPEIWKELLDQFAGWPAAPSLIVTSRLADDYLWSEALNLGAYDVLARPFNRAEVARSVALAQSHWLGKCASAPALARIAS